MDFVKRNPILTTILVICVAAFAVESYFLWSFNGKVAVAKRNLSNAQAKAESDEKALPAPTADNKAAALKNVDDLQASLNKTISTLTDTKTKIDPKDVPKDSAEFLIAVQSYVTKLQAKATEKGIVLPVPVKDYTFGMSMYIGGKAPAPPPEKIPAVYTQMRVLEYVLGHLMGDAKVDGLQMMIAGIARENVGVGATNADSATVANDIFTVSPLVSVRGPGLNTYAFQIQFISYTESLRLLLNDLKTFDMPLVVRSIEVEPALESTITTAANLGLPPSAAKPTTAAEKTKAAKDALARKPVVTDNLSKFTLTFEYVELPKPAAAPEAEGAAGTAGTGTPATPAATGS